MTRYRHALPQLGDRLFLIDGGMETTLIYHDGLDLPHFASVALLKDAAGRETLRRYYRQYLAVARRDRTGFILESATWRASADWAPGLGYTMEGLAEANREAVAMLEDLRRDWQEPGLPVVVSACVGPRGDGYDPGRRLMTVDEAEAYHGFQVGLFAETTADMVAAMTMNNVPEAIGIVRAAQAVGLPVAVSFTVETDGRLPTGQSLAEAIAEVDEATGAGAAYFMINCAHPTHFDHLFGEGGPWIRRVRGLRANASTCSHAELDAMTELDAGDPHDLAARYGALVRRFPHITVLGGCCGTDHHHIACISEAVRIAA